MTFKDRLQLEKKYKQWIRDNCIEDRPMNVIAFLFGEGLLSEGWVPCDEGLPEIDMSYPHSEPYLVQYDIEMLDVAWYSNVNRFWQTHVTEPYWQCAQFCTVIAWRPLPKMYKGET